MLVKRFTMEAAREDAQRGRSIMTNMDTGMAALMEIAGSPGAQANPGWRQAVAQLATEAREWEGQRANLRPDE